MKVRSIRFRLLAFALAAVLLGLTVSGLGLVALFGRHVERRVGTELDSYLTQLAGNLRIDADNALYIAREPGDPRFSRILGGLYWQVEDEAHGRLLRSRSLWDTALALPKDVPEPGNVHEHRFAGPGGQSLLVHEQRVILEHAGVDRPARLAAAIDM
ncbi:MAG: sensor histidine kinase, partial [Hyphomicrobiaceae bacterium]|nr:sensor histidine kinase [Hyphomicrobiaceae bacterium]